MFWPGRFYCARARSKASNLVRCSDVSGLTDGFAPIKNPGVIGLVGDALWIRLKSRKNRLGGDAILRKCTCVFSNRASIHAPRRLCQRHCLWQWVVNRAPSGKAVFGEKIADKASEWLKIALEARGVAGPQK